MDCRLHNGVVLHYQGDAGVERVARTELLNGDRIAYLRQFECTKADSSQRTHGTGRDTSQNYKFRLGTGSDKYDRHRAVVRGVFAGKSARTILHDAKKIAHRVLVHQP